MSKVGIGPNGKIYTYGLNGEMARNYVKYGVYANDQDSRLRPRYKRWFRRLFLWA